MPTRLQTTAATRRALLLSAGALLDLGGPDAVTLREVGARAGVSRSAPYRHFQDKEGLLMELATQAWTEIGDSLELLAERSDLTGKEVLRGAMGTLLTLSHSRPHLYRLMFTAPATDPAAAVRAASRAQNVFLDIVARFMQVEGARQYAGLLLTSMHGIAGLEMSGHLTSDKWHASAEDLLDLLVELLPAADSRPAP